MLSDEVSAFRVPECVADSPLGMEGGDSFA